VSWQRVKEPTCLRGLHFTYRVTGPMCRACFLAALDERWPQLVKGRDQLGVATIDHRTLPFAFALRTGLSGDDVELIYRVSASPPVRDAVDQGIEAALEVALGSPHTCSEHP
jgi:hypothetical protein